ncbi:MAG: HAD hydrolase-like protein [Proteobacteria bacterium]|nr:HAD hydrolase-like protein [Pseudomonadota bacterium]
MNFKKPEAFIFDWDNTLSDAWDVMQEIINQALIHFHKEPWSMEQVKANTHRSAKDFFPDVFKEQSEDAFTYLGHYVKSKEDEHFKKLKPIQGAKKLLQYLESNHIPCAILSNKQGPRLRLEVDYMGFSSFFKGGIFGSLDFEYDKPHALPVQKIKEQNNWQNKTVWFVGDTDVDIECAQNSHCTPVRIDADEKHKSNLCFKDCMHLLNYLRTTF